MNLPSIKQALEFRRVINLGREAMGLEALEKLDYDDAEPGSPSNCLSARNLFAPAGYIVGADFISARGSSSQYPEVLAAIGSEERAIPRSISVVTDPFDLQVPGLRERLAEAGVI